MAETKEIIEEPENNETSSSDTTKNEDNENVKMEVDSGSGEDKPETKDAGDKSDKLEESNENEEEKTVKVEKPENDTKNEKDNEKDVKKEDDEEKETVENLKIEKSEKEENDSKAEATDEKKKKKTNEKSPRKKRGDGKENDPLEKIGERENVLDHVEIRRDGTNRVKIYMLCDSRIWEDKGTGHVMCVSSAEDGSSSNSSPYVILVRLEGEQKNVLESRILMDTVYQKQQETLIVWSESDAMDLALSFQEKSGCEELWNKICEVQGRDPGDADGAYDDEEDSDVSELASSTSRLALPPIEIARLSEIDAFLHMNLSNNASREKMANLIESEAVLPKLCDVFKMCEDLEHSEGLRTFYSIAKNMFMLNRTSMIELLLDDKFIKSIIGMFEWDPAYKHPRKHREFVYEKATFREVLHLSNDELKEKIHRLYRAQYIQDACLPSLGLFEENLLSTLNSHILFSRVDIVTLLQKDRRAMRELFTQLKSPDTDLLRRRDLAMFLKEMIFLSTNLPTAGGQGKENFFRQMLNNDILEGIEPCMKSVDYATRSTMVEILKSLVEHNPQIIRDYLLKQSKDQEDDNVLLNQLISHLLTDIDPHLTSGTDVILIMKTLLDPDTMTSIKSERSEFLQLFYHRCIHTMLKPLLENVLGGAIKKDDYTTANRQSMLIRLLTFCIEHHSYSMRQHCISTDLLNKVLLLLKSRHHYLSLYALKLLQRVVSVKDDYYIRYIVREKVLDPVVQCFKHNGTRYNVINSAILHIFDFIKQEDVRPLIKYIVETHGDMIDTVNYVKTFKELKIRYDQHRDREETMSIRSEDNSMASPRSLKKDRQEDQWFEDDDDMEVGTMMESIEKDVVTVAPKKEEPTSRKTGIEPMFPSLLKRKNAFDDDEAAVFIGGSPSVLNHNDKKIVIKMNTDKSPSRTPSPASSPRASPGPSREDEVTSSQNNSKENSPAPTVKSLVDYDESDSDEEITSPDAVPSSSTGSPESEKDTKSVLETKKSVDSPEYNSDVSSTSNEDKDENEISTATSSDGTRKRTSDGLDPIEVKRCRTEENQTQA